MAIINKCHGMLVFVLLVLTLSLSSATRIKDRHSMHLSVSEPDDPRFTLKYLARVYYTQLEDDLSNNPNPADIPNPFNMKINCQRRRAFRTIDGTCNNLNRPFLGAAKTPLMRLVKNTTYEDGINAVTDKFFSSRTPLPTARNVSLAVHDITSNMSKRHSHLLMGFGQFIDHDMTLSPESDGEGGEDGPKEKCCHVDKSQWIDELKECFVVSTPNDPIFKTECVPFLRSAPTPGFPGAPVQRYQLNDLTSFIDASQVYGSTNLKARSLRSFEYGKLRSSEGPNKEERLPMAKDNPSNCSSEVSECRFAAGDIRNSEQASLTSVHTLLLREHNRIAGEIKRRNPKFKDERIYQTTRKIIGAILQRITYNEFLPEVLGPELMRSFGLSVLKKGRFRDYNNNANPSIVTEFSTAAFRFGHSLIRQRFSTSATESEDLKGIFDAFKTVDRFGNDGILGGLCKDRAEFRERFITRGIRDNLMGGEMDLPAFNIQRGRDHGLASYNSIRKYFKLPVYKTFYEMVGKTHTQDAVNALKRVYPTVDDVEMFPGGLSELSLKDAIVGETFGNIIAKQFRVLKYGDRFWFETDNKNTRFTAGQLAEIRKSSLAGLFCKNVPGSSVRKSLFVTELGENPIVDCATIPSMDFSAWRM